MSKPVVFIDGEAGTTGLGIRERLAALLRVEVRSIDAALRKDPAARKALMSEVDLVVLCLPDEASKEATALVNSLGAEAPKLLDASSAFRVANDWTYGFAELAPGQAEAIATADRVSNPGCYPTGAIALLRPLVDAGLVPRDYPIAVHAVSGYSGGGRSLIDAHERDGGPAFELYGLALSHKHVPELHKYSGLTRRPIFVPSVGHFRQGMLVTISLHADLLPGRPARAQIEEALAAYYARAEYVRVVPVKSGDTFKLEPEALNDTNRLELRVYGDDSFGHIVLVARLDNLGKGASGAAVQNLRLMLGV